MTSPLLQDYNVFERPNLYPLTTKQYEEHKETADIIQWGRENPVKFAEEFFGIELMDFQIYIIERTWTAEQAVWCCSRNAGKSILGAIYIMLRSLLIPNHQTYICTGVGSQSIELFQKIEKLSKNQIPSFKSLTNVFGNELVKAHGSDGFVHDPSSHSFRLYNGSGVHTLNGAISNLRSKRSNLNFYDECGFAPDELFNVTMPFLAQNSKFALGVNYSDDDALMEPRPFPNQAIFASSAGRTDQFFYKKYRECSIRMDAGDDRYFCADIDCDAVIGATRHGILLSEPLLNQETIDSAMRKDKDAALREYRNIFQTEGGNGQLIKRASIVRNSYPYVPQMANTDRSQYIISWDPARQADNSTVCIAKLWKDQHVGWKMRIENVVVLIDRLSKAKRMMNAPNQVEEVKNIILDYNGPEAADYENIAAIMVDSGSGGAGIPLTDYLSNDWERNGVKHRGLIDPEFNEGDDKKFPNAVSGKLHLISPIKYRSMMFEEMKQLIDLGVVEFPEEYTQRGYVNLIYQVDKDNNTTQIYSYPQEKAEKQLKKEGYHIDTMPYTLSPDEELALTQIDMMKNEVVNMYRFTTASGQDRFDLAPDKAKTMHDDRNYTLLLCCHYLAQLRREPITNKRAHKYTINDIADLPVNAARRFSILN